jgi:hypothetical protein
LTLPPLALWPVVALLVLYAAFYVQAAGELVAFPFDFDQGEGYDAWSGWLLANGHLPYTENETFPYYSSNYPPVWSWLVSLPMRSAGPGLAPARAISAAAGLLAVLLVGLAARRLSGSALAGLLAGGLFLASPYLFHTAPLARVNSTALLLSLLGLTLFEIPTRARLVLGSLVLLAAVFTKQTAFDATLAGLVYVLFVSRPGAALAAAVIGVGGLMGLALLMWLTRGAFWLNAFAANVNPFDFEQLASYGLNFVVVHCVVLGFAIYAIRDLAARSTWSPWVFYLVVSGLMALASGKWGAGESYFLGPLAAGCVLAAIPMARLLDGEDAQWRQRVRPLQGRRWGFTALVRSSRAFVSRARSRALGGRSPFAARYLLAGAIFVQALIFSHGPLSEVVPWLPDRGFQAGLLGTMPSGRDRAGGDEIVAMIVAAQGQALSEDPSFTVAAGQPIVANATHLRNLHEAGLWRGTSLVADVDARRFGIVILHAQLYPAPVLSAIGRSYAIDRIVTVGPATYQIFVPAEQ